VKHATRYAPHVIANYVVLQAHLRRGLDRISGPLRSGFISQYWRFELSTSFFIAPALIMLIGFPNTKKLVFDVADEVWDDDDALIAKKRGKQQRIALSDIRDASYSAFTNRVTLSVRGPSVLGEQITFAPPARFLPFGASPEITDLIKRIDCARQTGR